MLAYVSLVYLVALWSRYLSAEDLVNLVVGPGCPRQNYSRVGPSRLVKTMQHDLFPWALCLRTPGSQISHRVSSS